MNAGHFCKKGTERNATEIEREERMREGEAGVEGPDRLSEGGKRTRWDPSEAKCAPSSFIFQRGLRCDHVYCFRLAIIESTTEVAPTNVH